MLEHVVRRYILVTWDVVRTHNVHNIFIHQLASGFTHLLLLQTLAWLAAHDSSTALAAPLPVCVVCELNACARVYVCVHVLFDKSKNHLAFTVVINLFVILIQRVLVATPTIA
jgi:hypothetical protein